MKGIYTIVGILLVIIAYSKYLKDIFYGKTRPHLYSWILFSVITIVVWIAQYSNGAGTGSYITVATFVSTIIITILAFKYGTKDIKRIDKYFFLLVLLSLIPWFLTKDATLSVILIVSINVFAYFPTIRKTIKNPESETLLTYQLNVVRQVLAILALSSYSIATYLFPVSLIFVNLFISGIIMFRFPKKN